MYRQDQEAILAGLLGFLCLVLLVGLVITIFYLLTLQKALSRVTPRNRLMEPGMVWLTLIPVFNIIWNFFIATRIPDSLRNEFRDRGRDDGSDYGKGVGLTSAILVVVSIPLNMISQVSKSPAIGILLLPLGLASLIVFIMFWVKIAGYSSQLAASGDYPGRGPGQDGGDDYPDRGPRGRSSDAIQPDDPGYFK
jgi:hypothetical protein